MNTTGQPVNPLNMRQLVNDGPFGISPGPKTFAAISLGTRTLSTSSIKLGAINFGKSKVPGVPSAVLIYSCIFEKVILKTKINS